MPLVFLAVWLSGLFSLGLLASASYLAWLIYTDQLVGIEYFLLTSLLFLFSLFGKYFVLSLYPSRKMKTAKVAKREKIPGEDESNLQINYFGKSKDKAIILTHGWGLNSKVWEPIIARILYKNSFITWDLPGLGESSKPANNNYNLENLAKNLKRVIDHLPSENLSLIGHSIGGMTILTFCRLFPEYLGIKISKIFIINSTYTKPTKTAIFSAFLQAIESPIITSLCYITISLSSLVRVMNYISYQSGLLLLANALTGFSGGETREELDFATKFNLKESPDVIARGILAMLHFNESRSISKIPIPVEIIYSTKDRLTLPDASYYMNEKIRKSKVVKIKGGHLSIIDRAKEFVKKINLA